MLSGVYACVIFVLFVPYPEGPCDFGPRCGGAYEGLHHGYRIGE